MTLVVIGPDRRERFQEYFERRQLPWIVLPDPEGHLLAMWGQAVVWWRLGRMPGAVGLDAAHRVVWTHRGRSMSDLPDWDEALRILSPDPNKP